MGRCYRICYSERERSGASTRDVAFLEGTRGFVIRCRGKNIINNFKKGICLKWSWYWGALNVCNKDSGLSRGITLY